MMTQPLVGKAAIYRAYIQNFDRNGQSELKNVLCTGTGRFYELNHVIKKAIFGLVVHAFMLDRADEAMFIRTSVQVAIKVYSESLIYSQFNRSCENPYTEMSLMQYIGSEHDNLIGQIECCVDESRTIYSVMKYHSGEELFDHILKNGKMSEIGAKGFFGQLLIGLATLHSQGVAHRDVSLENILFDAADGSCAIIDFGMSVHLRHDPCNGMFYKIPAVRCGKTNYIPPELQCGMGMCSDGHHGSPSKLVDPMQGDMWSAGICLLYVLLGFPPLVSATSDDIRYQYIVRGQLPELLQHWGLDPLSAQALDLLQRMLKEDPCERISAQDALSHPFLCCSSSSTSSPLSASASSSSSSSSALSSALSSASSSALSSASSSALSSCESSPLDCSPCRSSPCFLSPSSSNSPASLSSEPAFSPTVDLLPASRGTVHGGKGQGGVAKGRESNRPRAVLRMVGDSCSRESAIRASEGEGTSQLSYIPGHRHYQPSLIKEEEKSETQACWQRQRHFCAASL